MNDSIDWMVYHVEMALKRMNRSRVTSTRNADHVLYRLDFRWEFRVDADELEALYDDIDSPSSFKDRFDRMTPTNLRLNVMVSK